MTVQYRISPDEISELLISMKEDNHPSCQCLGYRLFLGHHFPKCSELSPAEKPMSNLDNDSSFDATGGPPVIYVSQLMHCAEQLQRDLPGTEMNAWNLRASLLNNSSITRHGDGLPVEVQVDGVELNTNNALKANWLQFCKVMKNSVTKPLPSN